MNQSAAGKTSRIEWPATLKLAFARSLAASAVWAVILATTGARLDAVAFIFLLGSLFLPFAALMQHAVLGALKAIFASLGIGIGVLAANLMQLMTSIAVAAGDPLVYIFNRQFPHVLNVTDFKFLNLVAIILVRREAEEIHD